MRLCAAVAPDIVRQHCQSCSHVCYITYDHYYYVMTPYIDNTSTTNRSTQGVLKATIFSMYILAIFSMYIFTHTHIYDPEVKREKEVIHPP
jgi:hypothetical protein